MNRKSVRLAVTVLLVVIISGCGRPGISSKSGKTYDYRSSYLDNGLQVISLEDYSCPIAHVQLWYHVGSKNESQDRNGFAHMFEHMMFKGTDTLDAEAHHNYIRMVGGTNNAYTSFDKTVYHQTVPTEQLDMVMYLEAERMAFLKIDQEAFETERKVIEEELRMRQNEPYGTTVKKAANMIYDEQSYRWTPIGNLSHLRATEVSELREFWKKYYVPNNAVLVVTGAVSHEEVREKAEKYFGWIKRCPDVKPMDYREPLQSEKREFVIDDEKAPAAMFGIVWRTVPLTSKDMTPLDLLSTILGGGRSSRMYRSLVADNQTAVAAMSTTWNLELDGVFMAGVMFGPKVDNETADAEIWRLINDIKANGVTDKEMTRAKNQMEKSYVMQNLTIESKAQMLASSALLEDNVERVNEYLDEIRSVTNEDIIRVANQYLSENTANVFELKQNLTGSSDDETAEYAGEPELVTPPPGRAGTVRPEDWPKEPPIADTMPEAVLTAAEPVMLDNGIAVYVVQNHEVPFVTVRYGIVNRGAGGTANMAAAMLTQGTKTHSEAELSEKLETNAISLGGAAAEDTVTVSMNCLRHKLGLGLELMREVISEPLFDSGEFEKQKQKLLTSLEIQSQSPEYKADWQFRKCVYGGYFPYSSPVTGTPEDVEKMTAEDVREWWYTNRTRGFQNPAVIFVGDIKPAEAAKLARKYFGDFAQYEQLAKIMIAPQMSGAGEVIIVDKPDTQQCQIRVGHQGLTRHDIRDYARSKLVSSYYGGAFSSRLNEELRVKNGLTYSAWGFNLANKDAARFEINTFTKTEKAREAVERIFDTVNDLQQREPEDDEISLSKSYFKGAFVRGRETPQQIADDIWLVHSQMLPADYLSTYLGHVIGSSQDDCLAWADKYLDPQQMVVVIAGDAEKIRPQFEGKWPVKVISE
jgi:zinc protease